MSTASKPTYNNDAISMIRLWDEVMTDNHPTPTDKLPKIIPIKVIESRQTIAVSSFNNTTKLKLEFE